MSPTWLKAHASYIASFHTKTTEQLTFNRGSADNAALLKVPMIPAGVLDVFASLTVEIVVSHDVSIGTARYGSDILYGVSDGNAVFGITTRGKADYRYGPLCNGFFGHSGTKLRGSVWVGTPSPKPSDSFYPGQFAITLKVDEHWGSCYTAHDGGFVNTAYFKLIVLPHDGLTLEVYKANKFHKVGIKYIEVTILQDAASLYSVQL